MQEMWVQSLGLEDPPSPGEDSDSPHQYSCLKIPGQRCLVGYSPWGHERVEHDLMTKQQISGLLYTDIVLSA